MNIGAELAGYRLEEVIGRGGMGVVYRARDVRLDRVVALKLIAPELGSDPTFRQRFQKEARVAASIDHPHVVPIFEAGDVEGHLFVAMRLVEGTDLSEMIATRGALDPATAVPIVAQVAKALDAAHAKGLVHRDVKPANILLAPDEHAWHSYLVDFGLTKRTASKGMTRTGQWVGTLGYVAPEQIEGAGVDRRTDVYALGCVLYEAITGELPFDRDSDAAMLWAHLNSPPPRASETAPVPGALDDVIATAMAKDPEQRFGSAAEMGRAATAALGGRAARRAVSARSASTIAAPPPPRRDEADAPTRAATTTELPEPIGRKGRSKGRAIALALAAIVLVGAGAAVALLLGREDEDEPAPRRAAVTSPRTVTRTVGTTVRTGAAPTIEETPAPAPPTTTDSDTGSGFKEMDDWPSGRAAWTVVLESFEGSDKRDEATADAATKGVTDGGVLWGGNYPGFRPGWWAVFSGEFDSLEDARAACQEYRDRGIAEDANVGWVDGVSGTEKRERFWNC